MTLGATLSEKKWPQAFLTVELLASSAPSGKAGFDTFAEQVAFELGDACEQGCHHALVRGVEFECLALHCNQMLVYFQ